MPPAKQTHSETKSFKSTDGRTHPLFYDGKMIFIGHKEVTTFEWDKVPHGSRLQLDIALKNKEMVEVQPSKAEESSEDKGE